MRYVYSVVRYVPNPASGEFVNIGAIVGSDEAGEWRLNLASNLRRARSFGPPESLNAALAFMTDVGRRIDDTDSMFGQEVSEHWLSTLHDRHRNVVQLSRPATVVADKAIDAIDFVFAQVMTDDDEASIATITRTYATRRNLVAELRSSYSAAHIAPGWIRERTLIRSGPLQAPMDFVVGNGTAVQLAHTWSFEIRTYPEVAKEVKAWGYTLKALRDHGGETTGDRPATIDPDVTVEVLYAPPRTREQIEVFGEAEEVFRDLDVRAVPRDQAGNVADDARYRLSEAGLLPDLMP
jgi:hypothetical protein